MVDPVLASFAGAALSLVTLWFRLRFRLRSEQERRQYLLTAASTLPSGSRLQEQRHDGTRLVLIIGASPSVEEPQ